MASGPLARPVGATVTFDTRSGRTSTGLPLEHIKAGTLAGLVEYLCFYAARARRPELVVDAKLGLDEDFAAIFWTLFPGFATVRDVTAELTRVAERAAANRDHVWAIAVCDAVTTGIDPVNRYLLWLPPHQQAELVAGAERVAHAVQRGFRSWEAPAHPPGSVGVIAAARQPEALADLEAKIMLARVAVDIASTSGVTAHLLPTTVLTLLADFVGTQETAAATSTFASSGGVGTLSGTGSSSGSGVPAGASPRASLAGVADLGAGSRLSLRGSRPSAHVGGGAAALSSPTASLRTPLPDGGAAHTGMDAVGGGGGGGVDLHATFDTLWAVPYDLLAAQWTYIEHALFRAIPASEFLACGWDKARYEHASDAFRRYADHFNAMSLWVTAEVLSQGSNPARAAMVVRFIKVGVCLRRYNNFSGLVQLCLGLRRDIVARLSDTWDLVPAPARERLDALYALTDDRKNYRSYKEALKMLPATAPVVPHLGAHTAELTMQVRSSMMQGKGGEGAGPLVSPKSSPPLQPHLARWCRINCCPATSQARVGCPCCTSVVSGSYTSSSAPFLRCRRAATAGICPRRFQL